jgi:pyridoxal biosynthesis lyase PdxS
MIKSGTLSLDSTSGVHKTSDAQNYSEAVKEAYKAYVTPELSPSIQESIDLSKDFLVTNSESLSDFRYVG